MNLVSSSLFIYEVFINIEIYVNTWVLSPPWSLYKKNPENINSEDFFML